MHLIGEQSRPERRRFALARTIYRIGDHRRRLLQAARFSIRRNFSLTISSVAKFPKGDSEKERGRKRRKRAKVYQRYHPFGKDECAGCASSASIMKFILRFPAGYSGRLLEFFPPLSFEPRKVFVSNSVESNT